MLLLRWPNNPKQVAAGDALELSLLLENTGTDRVEFIEAFLELFGRLLDDNGDEVHTPGFRTGRRMPRRHYVIDPGEAERVGVSVYISLTSNGHFQWGTTQSSYRSAMRRPIRRRRG